MKIILSEKQYSVLCEQSTALLPRNYAALMLQVYENKEKLNHFINKIRPEIEERAKRLFPANDLVKKDPNFKNSPKYRELKDKEDAYAHQLASAMAASIFGEISAAVIGQANEIKGALRIFFKGAPNKGIGRFEKFSSGWDEDNANNMIGIQIAQKYPNKNLDFYSQMVLKNIQSNNYFDSTGKKKK